MENEFAGMIEKVGSNVSKFKVGDRVYARMTLDKIAELFEKDKSTISEHIKSFFDFSNLKTLENTTFLFLT